MVNLFYGLNFRNKPDCREISNPINYNNKAYRAYIRVKHLRAKVRRDENDTFLEIAAEKRT